MDSGPRVLKWSIAAAMLSAFPGCGGGDGGSASIPPPDDGPGITTGVFKDSNVTGLSYTSGSLSGVTRADGTFDYVTNQPAVFKVGAVTLGTAAGNSVVTPVDLVTDGSSATPAVLNIARFLMMLDADGNPDNGIVISSNVQTRATSWGQVNFADVAIDTALESLAADARSADAGGHVVPSADAAKAHLEATFRCAASGAYRGTFTGAEQGRFAVVIAPNSGGVVGLGGLTGQPGNFAISGDTPVSVDQQASFTAHSDHTGATFSGRMQWDALSGRWEKTGTAGGVFSGTRLLGRREAVYRYSGFFHDPALPESGVVTFDVDAAGKVTGVAYGSLQDQLIDFSGTLSGGTLTATATNGAAINASAPLPSLNFVQGTWTGTGAAGSFSGVGCKLN